MILNLALAKTLLKDHLFRQGYGARTIQARISYLSAFDDYLRARGIIDLRDVGEQAIYEYVSTLHSTVSCRTGRPYAVRTLRMMKASLKLLFSCLYQGNLVLSNPARNVEVKFVGAGDEKAIFTQEEIRQFLDAIDIKAPYGLRDRAIFELIYSSGLRISEAANLDLIDFDAEARMLYVRKGKFGKDRVVPVSLAAAKFLGLLSVQRKDKRACLFLGYQGRLKPAGIEKRFRRHLAAAGIARPGLSVHSIRHSCATHLLEAGADIRYVQELLGHDSVETTVLYTHQQEENLKKAYRSYHPRENELYLEVGDAYLGRIGEFEARLSQRKKKRGMDETGGLK